MSNPKDLTSFPYSNARPFTPTIAYYIHNRQKHYKLWSTSQPTFSPSLNPTSPHFSRARVLGRAKTLHISADAPPAIYDLHKENLFGTRLIVKDGTGTDVAEWQSPVVSYGKTAFSFPQNSEHSTEGFVIKTVELGRRAEVCWISILFCEICVLGPISLKSFVKDSITYI